VNKYADLLYVFVGPTYSKVIPVQAWLGPECSRRLRLPDFMAVGTWRW